MEALLHQPSWCMSVYFDLCGGMERARGRRFKGGVLTLVLDPMPVPGYPRAPLGCSYLRTSNWGCCGFTQDREVVSLDPG